MNVINLRLPKDLTRISGNDYGCYIYETQIRHRIKNDEKNQIVFPNNIEGISISFIKGMTDELIDKYSKEKLFEYFDFYSVNEDVVRSIKKSIEF